MSPPPLAISSPATLQWREGMVPISNNGVTIRARASTASSSASTIEQRAHSPSLSVVSDYSFRRIAVRFPNVRTNKEKVVQRPTIATTRQVLVVVVFLDVVFLRSFSFLVGHPQGWYGQ